MSHRDYYAILGVPHDAELSLLQANYWRLAHQCKAALNSDPQAPRLLRELNAAYEVLSAPQLRRQYDEVLARADGRPETAPGPRPHFGSWRAQPLGDGKDKAEGKQAVLQPEPTPSKTGRLETSLATRASDAPPQSGPAPDESQDVREALAASATGPRAASASFGPSPGRFRRLLERLALRVEEHRPGDEGQAAAAVRDSTAAIVARLRQSVVPSDGRSWPPTHPGERQPPASYPPTNL